MAGSWKWYHSIILSLFIVVEVENSKLNVPRVLLPIFSEFSLNFTLEGTGSECYRWSTSRPEVVRLSGITEGSQRGCSSKAMVTANTREFTRNTAIVFAEEHHSGNILRCDVIIDVISSLNIVTTTRELFVEEAPEAFEVRAYDAQGNEFSTLEGVEFKWSLSAWSSQDKATVKGTNVIRFMTFTESPYETPPTVQELDSHGGRGHIVLLEGLKTGTAKVQVQLPHKEYSHVPPIEVQLAVMSNLIITPGDVYIMPGDTLEYRVLQVRHGRLEDVDIQPSQFFWEVKNPEIVTVHEKTGVLSALSLGETQVFLHDRSVDESDVEANIPKSNVFVTDPRYLTLTILPHHNWAVMIGRKYEILVDIYNSDDHKMHIGDTVEVTTLIPKEYFQVDIMTRNGTFLYGEPLEVGTAQVRSTLSSVADNKGNIRDITPKLSVQANLMIYKAITVHPSDVILPWDPDTKFRYDVSLKATGGDGKFIWSSSNTTVATVSERGVVTTHCAGRVEIYAAMATNPENKGIAKVHVLVPEVLEIVEYVLETMVGDALFLHVALYTHRHNLDSRSETNELVPFTQCQDVPFLVRVFDEIFAHNMSLTTQPLGISCATIGLEAAGIGSSKVAVSYTPQLDILSDQVTVASFRPLVSYYPPSGEIVLAVGCSALVAFSGGPKPWVGRPSEHIRHVEVGGTESVIEVAEMSDVSEAQDAYGYQVLCKRLGEAELVLLVTNQPAVKHCRRSESSASIRVLCAKPRFLALNPVSDLQRNPGCPVNLSPERLVVQNYNDIKTYIVVKDEHGNTFNNITSLQIDWALSNRHASLVDAGSIHSEPATEGELFTDHLFYQTLRPSMKTGELKIKATLVGYNSQLLRDLDIVPEYPAFAILDEKGYEVTPEITAFLSLILVNDSFVSPNASIIFNHPRNKLVLEVNQGSGYYELILSSEEIAEVVYKEGTKVIEVYPKSEGILKLAVLDLCLPSKPSFVELQVVSISSIRVDVPERVEKGRCMSGVLRIYDTTDNLLPLPQPEFLDLRPHVENEIVSVTMQFEKGADGKSLPVGEVHFVITGLELGDTRLSFGAGRGSYEARSQPTPIQVFPPLRLLPQNITLVVGSIFQITSRGGPQPDPNVEYSMSGSTASVTKKGLVEGLSLGHTALTGRAVGFNKATGQRIVYSQATVDVHVVPLLGIKIYAPLSRILSEATMPMWAQGIPEQITPLILGSSVLPIKYNWEVSSREIGNVINVYHRVRLAVTSREMIATHFKSFKPGRVTVSVTVTVPGHMTQERKEEVEFRASMDIEVFEELKVMHPPDAGQIQSPYLLMAPNSEVALRTNREEHVRYTLLEKADVHVPLALLDSTNDSAQALDNTQRIVSVDANGVIKSYGRHGRAVVIMTLKEDFGLKQVKSVIVEVKPVHYMLASLRPEFVMMEDETIAKLPRGADVLIFISHHDNTGAKFTAVNTDVKLRINRFDITKLTRSPAKNIIIANLMHRGSTMLKIWDDLTYQHASDYIQLRVGDGILPSVSTITVGDVVCFSVPFKSKDELQGRWANDNPNVLELNTELGVGRARAAGTVVVKFYFNTVAYTSVEITVEPPQRVRILPLKDHIITNSDPDAVFRVPIVLRSESDKTKIQSTLSRNGTCPMGYMVKAYPFFCSLQFTNTMAEYTVDDVFAVVQEFRLETGQYACILVAAGDPPPNISTLETNITLTVDSSGVTPATVNLQFLPAIYVSTHEIHVSDAQMSGVLIVSAIPAVLKKLQVIPSSYLVAVIKSEEPTVEGSATYQVVLSNRFWSVGELSTHINISVVSEMTRQVIQIPLKVHLAGSKDQHMTSPCLVSRITTWGSYLGDTLFAYRHTLTILATLVVIIAATVYGYSSFITPMSHANQLRRESIFGSGPIPSRMTVFAPSDMYSRQSMFPQQYPGDYFEPRRTRASSFTRRGVSRMGGEAEPPWRGA